MKRMKDKSWLSKKSFPSDQSSSFAAEAAESRSSALISTNILCERKFSMKKMDDFLEKWVLIQLAAMLDKLRQVNDDGEEFF